MWLKLTDIRGVPVAVDMTFGTRFRQAEPEHGRRIPAGSEGSLILFPNGHSLLVTDSFDTLCKRVCAACDAPTPPKRKLASV
jgi:hypothetical protein